MNPLNNIYSLVKTEFDQVNALIEASLHTDVGLIEKISDHIIHSGGKRLRPLLALLAGRAVSSDAVHPITLAVIVEFLHTATLLHDDVVDGSELRRGKKTANVVWGNSASILVGDFLYSRAFQLMFNLQHLGVYSVLADAANVIAQGEVLQLIHSSNVDIDEASYREVIRCKTATLFSAAAESSALVAAGNQAQQETLRAYGLHFGMAFQMMDDLLDYGISVQQSGKNPGDDLAEGKVTLPLIYAMRVGNSQQVNMIKESLKAKSTEGLAAVLQVLKETEAEQYVKKMAQEEIKLAKLALNRLDQSPYKQALIELAEIIS